MDIFDFSDGREGYYGEYGGVFLPEILHATIEELLECFRECKADPKFWQEYVALLQNYSGRPTPLTHLENLSRELGGAQIYVKRDDLNHTGSHKVNNVMGQGLLTQRLGKKRVIAETGAGSMVLLLRLWRQNLVLIVRSTWVRLMLPVNVLMCFGWKIWVPKLLRLRTVKKHSKML
jgi:hypothetical protein